MGAAVAEQTNLTRLKSERESEREMKMSTEFVAQSAPDVSE